jgi:hypothetical protein
VSIKLKGWACGSGNLFFQSLHLNTPRNLKNRAEIRKKILGVRKRRTMDSFKA